MRTKIRRIGRTVVQILLVTGFAGVLWFTPAASVSGQENDRSVAAEPIWVLLERGKYAFERREYGEALRLFRAVKERNPDMPEADIAIGNVFRAEGELDLALMQFQRAYDRRNLLIVPDDRIDLLYRMAEIHRMRDEYLQFEALLTAVVTDVDSTYEQRPSDLRDPLVRIVTEDGLDRLLELYRIEDHGAQRAHYELSRFFLYRSRRFTEAVVAVSYSVIMTLTEMMTFARYVDPEYPFTTVENLLSTILRFPEVEAYVTQTELYEQLFVLGHALFAAGRLTPSETVRQTLMRIDPAGPAGIRAARSFAPID